MDISVHTHHHHQQQTQQTSIEETLESSIQHLVADWQRRQRWQVTSVCCQQEAGGIKRAPWRAHLAGLLESLPAHVATISLLLLDLTLTVLDLSSSLLSCGHKRKAIDRPYFYHWAGVAILSLLLVKAVALAVALGLSFFGRPGRVVDVIVVAAALVLEATAEGKGAGLLVVVSLWRVVRVAESAFELSNEAIEAQIEGVVLQFEELRGENHSLQEAVAERDERIEELEEELAWLQNTVSDGSLHGSVAADRIATLSERTQKQNGIILG